MTPLLSPRPLSEYSAKEYLAYVTSLYQEPERAVPVRDYSVRLTAKGSPSVTVRNRKPQWLSYDEAASAARELGYPYQSLLEYLRRRKIELRRVALPPRAGPRTVTVGSSR